MPSGSWQSLLCLAAAGLAPGRARPHSLPPYAVLAAELWLLATLCVQVLLCAPLRGLMQERKERTQGWPHH